MSGMTHAAIQESNARSAEPVQAVTFRVGGVLAGLPINDVREIVNAKALTDVPRTPDTVRGVVNLRGEVVTVVDLRILLQQPVSEITRDSVNIVVQDAGEPIALLVDRIFNVVLIPPNELAPAPANISDVDERLVAGVYRMPDELLLVLDVQELLRSE
jgi:purine-binding chemotaxis protein CheW